MIQMYYGFGKGKTTAALGLGMRAHGAGKSVLLVRFLKDSRSSELSTLPYEIYPSPEKLSFNPGKEYQPWVDGALEYVKNSNADVILLDEFIDIVGSFIGEKDAVDFLKALGDKEIVITGHKRPEALFEASDYVTLVHKEKHPFDKGIKARRGIEY